MLAVFLSLLTLQAAAFAEGPFPIKVTGSAQHRLVLMSDGTVLGWGVTDYGALGPPALLKQDSRHVLKVVALKFPRKVIDIAATDGTSLALLDDGTVVGCGKLTGSETGVLLPDLSDIVKIDASGESGIALRRDGTVFSFGGSPLTSKQIPGLQNIKDISYSGGFGLALDKSGSVWSWGLSDYTLMSGVLGRKTNPLQAEKVNGLSDIVSISAEIASAVAVKKDGTVWVWGSNQWAQLANGRKSDMPNRGTSSQIYYQPQKVAGISTAVAAVPGTALHIMVLMRDGTLRTWGNNQVRQAGIGHADDYLTKPVTPKISGVKTGFIKGMDSFAIKKDHTLWAWGGGTYWGFPYFRDRAIPQILKLK